MIFGGWWRWALVSPDGVVPSRMVSVSASVNLPLHHKVQKFSSGTGSPGWSRKKGRKTVVVVMIFGVWNPEKIFLPICYIFSYLPVCCSHFTLVKSKMSVFNNIIHTWFCNSCTQWTAHTYEQTNSSLDWVLSHWAHFIVLWFIFVHVLFCVWLYIACVCTE